MSAVVPFRRTKIIFTLGPATESEEMLEKMIRAGADVVRLNMAHANHDWTRGVIRRVRTVSARVGREVAIMMDIKGPEIRTGDLATPIELKAGEIFDFTVRPGTRDSAEEIRSVDVNYQNLVNDISIGSIVLVDNGLLRLEVLEKSDAHIRCRVLIAGQLSSRRHINLPGVKVNLPAFTEKDRADTLVGLAEGIDFVALSFVREAKDVLQLREFLASQKSTARIIAKIEDQSAITHLDEIVAACDAMMVARGDLGIECPFEDLPVIQRRAVRACLSQGRPVIVATHMLESMIEAPMPTRAEVTDVANAIFEETDAIMLSGETTVGKYPLKCIEVFDKIATRIERSGNAQFHEAAELTTAREKVVKSAVVMANELKAAAIVSFTRHGHMARYAGWMRPRYSPIYAMCDNERSANELTLSWGVTAFVTEFDFIQPQNTIESGLKKLIAEGRLTLGDTVVIIGAISVGTEIVDAVQMRTV